MTTEEKRKLVLEFMRAAGKKGGLARKKAMSKEQLSAIGRAGATKRWAQARAKKPLKS